MLALIRAIHASLKGAHGSSRMVRELRTRGFSASKERVERLTRETNFYARHKRRYKVTQLQPTTQGGWTEPPQQAHGTARNGR